MLWTLTKEKQDCGFGEALDAPCQFNHRGPDRLDSEVLYRFSCYQV